MCCAWSLSTEVSEDRRLSAVLIGSFGLTGRSLSEAFSTGGLHIPPLSCTIHRSMTRDEILESLLSPVQYIGQWLWMRLAHWGGVDRSCYNGTMLSTTWLPLITKAPLSHFSLKFARDMQCLKVRIQHILLERYLSWMKSFYENTILFDIYIFHSMFTDRNSSMETKLHRLWYQAQSSLLYNT